MIIIVIHDRLLLLYYYHLRGKVKYDTTGDYVKLREPFSLIELAHV